MALGDQKCNRHPRHMARTCPHHGLPQEERCECPQGTASFDPPRAFVPDGKPHVTPVRLEGTITLDGIVFVITAVASTERPVTAEEIQRAAVRLKAATVPIGAVWT